LPGTAALSKEESLIHDDGVECALVEKRIAERWEVISGKYDDIVT
jgi:hypothetical protein